MMPAAAIRDAEVGDRLDLIDLWVEAWRQAMPAIDFEARRGWLDRRLDELQASGASVLVAETSERVPRGFVIVDVQRRYLDQLAVHPAHQSCGIASLLMSGAKALSPTRLDLDVNQDNARALRFYAKRGFQAVAVGRNPHSGLPTVLLQWYGTGRK